MSSDKGAEISKVVNTSHFGFLTGFLFTINLVIGAGLLSLPYAFRMSGYLISGLYTFLCCLFGFAWACMLIEVMSRCEAIIQMNEQGTTIKRPTFKEIIFGKSKKNLDEALINIDECVPDITHRRVDLCEMIDVLFGKNWKIIYMISLVFDTIFSLVGYTVVFSASLTSNLNLGFLESCDIYESEGFLSDCRKTYWFYLAILSGIVIYLTLIEMHEQKFIQNVLTILSLINVFLVLAVSISTIVLGVKIDSDQPHEFDFKAHNVFNIGLSLPIIMFATIYQTSLPSIIENVGDKTTNINKILKLVLYVSSFVYLSMGLLIPTAISNVYGQYNISFRNYSGGYPLSERPW